MLAVQEDKEGCPGWDELGWCSIVTKETADREVLEKENLPYSPWSGSISGPWWGQRKKNDSLKGEAVLLRVLAVVWRGEITFCPNPEDPFSSSLLVLSWSKLSSCHWKFDPAGAVWSFSVPYLTERQFLVFRQVNILPVLSVWESVPDGHSPYVCTSDWHS